MNMNTSTDRTPREGPISQINWTFYIDGVRCSKCIQKLESINIDHSEINEAQFDKTHSILTLKTYNTLSPQKMINWIEERGYQAYFVENPTEIQEHLRETHKSWLIRLAVTFFFTSNLMMFSLSIYFGASEEWKPLFSWLCGILYLPILFYSTIPLYKNAWQALKSKMFSADLAIVIAFLWGSGLSYINLFRGYSEFYFDSTSSFIFLILLARFFLYKAQTKIESNLNPSLLFKSIPVFKTLQNNIKKDKLYHEIEPKDLVTVQKNQTLPVDLQLCSQQAILDTSLYSGESLPQFFKSGEILKAGMISLTDELQGIALGAFTESELNQIFNGIRAHRNEKTNAQSKAEIYSQYLLITVSVLSLSILIYFGMHSSWEEGFRRALALFTIACPCSLALSIPLASIVAIQRAMENGLFVKTPLYFEKLQKLGSVVFDKTGTLTLGQMEFHSWEPKAPSTPHLEILYSMEQNSHHPLAKSLISHLNKLSINSVELVNVKEILGVGIDAIYKGSLYSIRSIENPIHTGLTGFELRQSDISSAPHSNSQLIPQASSEIILQAYFKDPLRPEATSIINQLNKLNIDIYLLSGDRPDVVNSLGKELQIKSANTYPSLSPQDKSVFIEKLQSSQPTKYFLMVGDGHNDALALSHADLSLAVNGCAETSLRAADAYAQKEGLNQVLNSLKLSRFYTRLINQNVALSLLYNFIAGVMAISGFVDPLVAAILMPINSFIVISATIFAKPKITSHD